MTDADVEAAAARIAAYTRAEQGLPADIEDPVAVANLAKLIAGPQPRIVTDDDIDAAVKESRLAQGLPEKITAPSVLGTVVTFMHSDGRPAPATSSPT